MLCRIYKKRHVVRAEERTEELSSQQEQVSMIGGANDVTITSNQNQQEMKFPRTQSLSYLLDLDYLGPIAHLLNDNNSSFDIQTSMGINAGFDPHVGPLSSYPNIGLSCHQTNGNQSYYK